MKKSILRLMLAFALTATFTGVTSCNSDDSDEFVISNDTHFNPPAWIHGKWAEEFEEPDLYSFEFTADNYILKFSNGSQNYNELINTSNAGGVQALYVVEEEKTNSRYKFIIKQMGGFDTEYDFQLQSDGSIIDKASILSDMKYFKRP